jgi:hypothetical protein
MPDFTVRVELHDGTWADYETLHSAMAAKGFSRTIAYQRVTYQLPTAEYIIRANITANEVMQSAKAAAATTRRRSAVFVTTATAWNWDGLAIASQQAQR